MERAILHVDCNKFYASVECLLHPEIRDKPVVVGGDEEARHGIVLTKNEIAAGYGIVTAEPLFRARIKCPRLVVVKPNYPLYMRFSEMVRKICADYTDLIEPFGLDEAWLDVTGSAAIFGDGEKIAHEIRRRVKKEIGITVSVGVSYNKIFAKLGSDYKKPDAVTVISKQNFKKLVWPLPADALLYIGEATYRRLVAHYRYTIGDVANTPPETLYKWFGKTGYAMHKFANGYDNDAVAALGNSAVIKSIGNSTTSPRDLENENDAKMVITVLSESVARRMREQGFVTSLVRISVRNNRLESFTRQRKLEFATDITDEITDTAVSLFNENYFWDCPIRSIGVCVSELYDKNAPQQISLFTDNRKRERLQRIDKTVDVLKQRYGNFCVQRASLLQDTRLTGFNPYNDHIMIANQVNSLV